MAGALGSGVVVTVLLPVRNAEDTIVEAVQSVLSQSMNHLRLVVVDDGSTDATAKHLVALADQDSRLRVISQRPLGLVHALNAALNVADSPFIARMDADDVMLPKRLELQLQQLKSNPRLSLVSTKVRMEPPTPGMQRYVDWVNTLEKPDEIRRAVFVESPVCHPTMMARTHVMHELGGYTDRDWAEDHDLWFRFILAGHQMAQVPHVLHLWRDTPERLTRVDPRYSDEARFRMKAHYLRRWLGSRVRIWGAGRDGKRLARALDSEGVEITTFVDIDPKKIGGVRRQSIPVISPESLDFDDDTPIVSAVGVGGARTIIREFLLEKGLTEMRDFICAA